MRSEGSGSADRSCAACSPCRCCWGSGREARARAGGESSSLLLLFELAVRVADEASVGRRSRNGSELQLKALLAPVRAVGGAAEEERWAEEEEFDGMRELKKTSLTWARASAFRQARARRIKGAECEPSSMRPRVAASCATWELEGEAGGDTTQRSSCSESATRPAGESAAAIASEASSENDAIEGRSGVPAAVCAAAAAEASKLSRLCSRRSWQWWMLRHCLRMIQGREKAGSQRVRQARPERRTEANRAPSDSPDRRRTRPRFGHLCQAPQCAPVGRRGRGQVLEAPQQPQHRPDCSIKAAGFLEDGRKG
jgi:hypothetical protein